MIQTGSGEGVRLTIHVIDGCSKRRAELYGIIHSIGYHAEIYTDLEDLFDYRPRTGLILLRDSQDGAGAAVDIQRLLKNGIWLPVVLVGNTSDPLQIVSGIKAGALDYLDLPLSSAALASCLVSIAAEAEEIARTQRQMIEARSRIACLSPRENEVLSFVTQGASNKIIGQNLNISPRTVEIHRANILTKLNTRHTIEAVRLKIDANLEMANAT